MAVVVEFIVGDPGYPPPGSNIYFNGAFAGKKTKVFREGLYQYTQLGSNYVIKPGTGTTFFIPEFGAGERIRIQTV